MGQLTVVNDRIVYEPPRCLRIVEVRIPVNRQWGGKSVDRYLAIVVMAVSAQLVEAAVDMNIRQTAKSLVEQSPAIRSLVDSGKLKIVMAKYDLDDGTVKLLDK